MSAPYGHFREAHSYFDQAEEQERMCGTLVYWEEQVACEDDEWDRLRDRGSVHLPSDTSYGSVALTIVELKRAA